MEFNERKGRRPRIGENRPVDAELNEPSRGTGSTENFDSNDGQSEQGDYQQRDYHRSNYRQGGYQPRQGGYRQGGFQQRRYGQGYNRYNNDYQPRQRYGYNNDRPENAEENNAADQSTQGGYQPRHNGYNRQDGYQRQGGYQPRPGGYQPRQGGYNRQGGYQPRQNGYNRQDGYQPRQGGYDRQGGYQPRQGGFNRQGGYNNRPGGYNNRFQGQGLRQNRYGMPQGGKSFTPRPRPVEYEQEIHEPDETIRLNKFMANAGICSRREADEFIQQGLVKVNGEVVTELGFKINYSDVVEYDSKVLALERKCYILLNKPKDCVTTVDDPGGRMTVLDLVKGACRERIYPVGRLDRNTTGVLLLTNDGDLASKLTHPKYVKKKIYHVWTDKDIAEEDMQRIADGIELEDGPIHADAISYATETDRNQAGIEIHSGRNRIVRRIFESLGYHVTKLDRVYFAGLTKKNLPRGRWRYLTQDEVNFLKMGSFE
ncbi:MAG: RNA-binding S4 domain-containing protein [Muribaculaceae bacterium]|nr:RNA-binding S4 domain-containing protein [Muribaculaceae bacterium]